MYDILIKNGHIIDGTGSPEMKAQIAIKDGKIVKIARCIDGDATQVIDATGKVITPGFIDSHSHSDNQFSSNPVQTEKIEQGITTSVAGQCGGSVCSANAGEFLDNAKGCKLGANMALLIGHGSIRRAVLGTENRAPTPEELEKMKEIMRSAMEHGALGVSFGLIYVPGCYAKTDELIEIAKIVGQYHGVAAIHLRNEGDELVSAVAEFIEIVRQSGVRGVISHHKVVGFTNRGAVNTTLKMLEDANAEGLELYADVYPYIASSTNFSSPFVPAAAKSGGWEALSKRMEDPENIAQWKERFYSKYPHTQWVMVTRCPGAEEYEGMRVPEIAEKMGVDEHTAAMEIIRLTKDQAGAVFFSMGEEDVETVIAHNRLMICTDSGVTTPKTTMYHPRLRGSFPRAIGRYVREKGVVSLPEMIRKMTAMPAAVYGLKSKGLVWEGFDADLCIFDPNTIIDRAEFNNPHLHAEGLDYVIVGGKIAAVNAVATGELGGTMLYRNV